MNNKRKKKISRFTDGIISYAVLILGAIIFLVPFLWMISTSLKTQTQIYAYPPTWIPNPVKWDNYPNAIADFPFWRYLANTALVSFAILLGTLFVTIPAGYAFARIKFRGSNFLFMLVLAVMMVPGQVTMIPIFQLMKSFGWMDSYYSLIIPSFCNSFSIFLMRQFFLTLPKSLEEAAMVDGCSPLRTLISIFIPLAKPAIATVSVLTLLNTWNSFLWPLILISTKEKQLITVGLMNFEGAYVTKYAYLMAAATLSMLPIFIIYLFAQDQFIEGIAGTGMKD